ncbi:MAG: S8 family serine peptidase, partial [Candidatus Margulisbacteria bacterium]|nr:S8 family serine peptidase [Candidatus Margulisiibacteriota bacterium]
MKKHILSLCVLLVFAIPALSAYAPDQIIVQFKPGITIDSPSKLPDVVKAKELFKGISTGITAKGAQLPDLSNTYLLYLEEGANIPAAVQSFSSDPGVIYAEPNYRVKALTTTPNDPHYSSQWFFEKIGAPSAWDVTTGSASVYAAVLDTGIDYRHVDLAAKIILGHDWANNDNDPMDDNGHGTHIAGIIGAVTDNSIGVAGVSWQSQIMAIKVLDSSGSGFISDVALGIREAADYPVNVINMSFGDYSNTSTLKNAVDYAYAKGCLMAAAAGNENTDDPIYPAAYDNVLAVAATDQDDRRSVWSGSYSASNYGAWVNIAAPGSSIYSTWRSDTYRNDNGTSMATPVVVGSICLLLSSNPALSQSDIKTRILDTADNIDTLNPGYEGLLGSGRLNLFKALGYPTANITSPSTGEVVSGTVRVYGSATGVSFSSYHLGIGAGASPSSFDDFVNSSSKVEDGLLGSFYSNSFPDGTYVIKLTTRSTNNISAESSSTIMIDNTYPIALISIPLDRAVLGNSATIEGTAWDTKIKYYVLEYATAGSDDYIRIAAGTSNVSGESLGVWDTSGLTGQYKLRLKVVDIPGHESLYTITISIVSSTTQGTSVTQSVKTSPNPFNPAADGETYFYYKLSENHDVSIYLFDISGNLIFKRSYLAGQQGGKAGENLVPWNGKNMFNEPVSNGVYLYKIICN